MAHTATIIMACTQLEYTRRETFHSKIAHARQRNLMGPEWIWRPERSGSEF